MLKLIITVMFGASLLEARATHGLAAQRTFSVEGGILSAVFASSDRILLQVQNVSHVGGDVHTTAVHRSLVTYGLKDGTLLNSVPLDDVLDTAKALSESSECGRIVYLAASNSVVSCNPDGHLTVSQLTQPQSRKEVQFGPDGQVSDFAVNEREKLLYVVSVTQKGAVVLSTYSFERGNRLQSQTLSTSLEFPVVSIAISDDGNAIAVAVSDPLNRKMRGSIVVCAKNGGDTECRETMEKYGIAETSFLTRNILLFVTSSFAGRGNRADCVQEMDVSSRTIDPHAFCREGTGVHYSLATIGRDAVVGFTGTASYNGFLETTKATNNDFTVWNVESRRVVATTNNINMSGFQGGIRLVADKTGAARFLGFQRLGSTVFLYDALSLLLPQINQRRAGGSHLTSSN